MNVEIEYRRDVTSPAILAGKKGDKRLVDEGHAMQLVKEGYARLVNHPETGTAIEYPPDPPPKKLDRKWVIIEGKPETETLPAEEATDGTAEQTANQTVGEASAGESADAGMVG